MKRKNWKNELIEWLVLLGMVIVPTGISIFVFLWVEPVTFWQKLMMVVFIPFMWVYSAKTWIYFFDI